MKDVLGMPFDQYQRYRLVADLLAALPANGSSEKLRVLDVGGRTALLRDFLTDADITLVDMEASEEDGLVLGDGARLPFQDDAFDAVCAFDTLEHVPPAHRAAFVSEAARVTRRWVVLAGPYHSERVAEAEVLLQRFMKDKLGIEHRYLEEHRHNGLPSRDDTESVLRELGARVESVGHANLERWLALMCLSMYMDNDAALRGLARSIHRFYNEALYASDHAEPVYRHLVIAAFGGAELPDAARFLSPPVAPAGALEPFTELTGELVAFDRERDAWRQERELLREAEADLRKDLDGNRETVTELRADFAKEREQNVELEALLESERKQQAKVVSELESDLTEHKKAGAVLEEDLAAHKGTVADLESTLSREREQARETAASLESDLAEHKKTLAALEATVAEKDTYAGELEAENRRVQEESAREREALQDDLRQHRATQEELQANLAAYRETQANLEQALRETEATAAKIQGELVQSIETVRARDEEIGQLRALLRDRMKNLKRALSPRKPDF